MFKFTINRDEDGMPSVEVDDSDTGGNRCVIKVVTRYSGEADALLDRDAAHQLREALGRFLGEEQ